MLDAGRDDDSKMKSAWCAHSCFSLLFLPVFYMYSFSVCILSAQVGRLGGRHVPGEDYVKITAPPIERVAVMAWVQRIPIYIHIIRHISAETEAFWWSHKPTRTDDHRVLQKIKTPFWHKYFEWIYPHHLPWQKYLSTIRSPANWQCIRHESIVATWSSNLEQSGNHKLQHKAY